MSGGSDAWQLSATVNMNGEVLNHEKQVLSMTLVTDQTMTEAPWMTVTTSKEGVFSIFF